MLTLIPLPLFIVPNTFHGLVCAFNTIKLLLTNFSKEPLITSVSMTPTDCNMVPPTPVRIRGVNLGPITASVNVTIGGQQCSGAYVSIAFTEIQCLPPCGVGQDLPLNMIIDVDGTTVYTNSLFSYYSPIIMSTTSSPTLGGEVILFGANFGPVGSKVVVLIDDRNCTLANVTIAHSTIVCVSPPGAGINLNVTIFSSFMSSGSPSLGRTNNIFSYQGMQLFLFSLN